MNIELNYREWGAGTPLILLHGNGENLGYFENQVDHFAKKYRVITIDTRGHGASPRGEAPFTIRQFASDLCAFMDRHGIPKAHILGFSDGGNIALHFALKHPQRVDRLILNGANLYGSGVKWRLQIPIVLEYWRLKHSLPKHPENRRKCELYGLMVNDPSIRPAELHQLAMPVLVIAGTKDMIRTSHTKLIARRIPGAQLAILPGDHFIAQKEFKAFNPIIERFLEN